MNFRYGFMSGEVANSCAPSSEMRFLMGIWWIDGRRLASLMIEHNVGLAPAKTYTLKRMDQDYFDNL